MDSITSGLANSSLHVPRIKIHQSIPADSIKKGPYAVVRSAALNDNINILRRYGEGSKPLFARDDITVNQSSIGDSHNSKDDCKTKQHRKSLSTESSSPERYRQGDSKKHSSPTSPRRKSPDIERDLTLPISTKKKPAEKLTYYKDEQRESDRTKRLIECSHKGSFVRDDIISNHPSVGDSRNTTSGYDRSDDRKTKQSRKSLSSESSSPERYRHREGKKYSPPSARGRSPERSSRDEKLDHSYKYSRSSKYNSSTRIEKSRRQDKSKSRTLSPPKKKKPTEKLPYYRDEQRERDRKRRLYGRSRSRTPTSSRRYSPVSRRRVESPARRRRSSSRDKYRRHFSYSSKEQHKSRRSRTRSKSSSPSRRDRERHRRSSRERRKEQKEDLNALTTAVAPPPQIIPIAVPVPADYAFPFPGWAAPQAPWHANQHRPPTVPHYASIPMLPMMPPLRGPHQAPFAGLPAPLPFSPMTTAYRTHHAGPRYPVPRHSSHNYHPRPKKPPT